MTRPIRVPLFSASLLRYGVLVLGLGLLLLIAWPQLMGNLLSTTGFMPHFECYQRRPELVWLHVTSDSMIGAAYVAISTMLAYLVYRARRDIPFQWMILAFGLFIIACGATHLMEVWTTWTPTYWLAGYIKLITAAASVSTAAALWPLVPRALSLIESAKLSEERRLRLETTNRELESLYTQVKDLDQLKTEFFANVSHELRTPLTLMLGPTEKLLSAGGLTDEQRYDLQVIDRNARTLLRHVNDLLEVARLDAKKLDLSYREVDLSPLVRLAASHFEWIAAERQISMQVEAAGHVPIQADPDKLHRVVFNLLSNAFKFVPAGGSVRCVVKREETRAWIEVEDSGPGVPAQLREKIFDRFQRGNIDSAGRSDGTGLGLAIAREFVELHGGSITVLDAPRGGALFRVELPVTAPAGIIIQPSEVETSSESEVESTRPPRTKTDDDALDEASGKMPDLSRSSGDAPLVLVVEDNREMSRFVASTLASEYRVATAFDGREALSKSLELRPDLIVSDMMMPEMSGDELAREIRSHSELTHIPVLLLTAKSDEALRSQMLREVVQDYLTKPFAAMELRARVGNLVTAKLVREMLQSELASQTQSLEGLAREVTARKRELEAARAALESARRQNDLILSSAGEGITGLDLQGKIIFVNPAGARMLGWKAEELIGRNKHLTMHHSRPDGTPYPFEQCPVHGVLNGGSERRSGSEVFWRKDGTHFPVEYVSTVIEEQGSAIGAVVVFNDVTERQQAEDELRASEERYRQLADAMPQIVWTATPEGDLDYYNRRWFDYTGLTLEQTRGWGWQPVLHPDDLERTLRRWATAISSRKPYEIEYRFKRGSDGAYRWHLGRAVPIFDRHGQLTKWFGTATDIDDQKRSGERLAHLASIVESTDDAIIGKTLEGEITSWNAGAERLYGYTAEEVTGRSISILMPPDRTDDLPKIIESLRAGKRVEHYETLRRKKDGTLIEVSLTISPIKDSSGEIVAASVIARDITERKRAEEAQRFLGDATALLATSLDYERTLESVAQLAVPRLADYCLVDMLDDDGAIRRMVVAHADPSRAEAWREMQRHFPLDPSSSYTIPKVLRTGEAELYRDIPPSFFAAALDDPEHISALEQFGIKSSMIVPLVGRGETLGAISFIATESNRHYDEGDLSLAADLARRAAQAIENARLYGEVQQANRVKDEFLATLSHELRTPLTPIIGWVHMMRAGILSPADLGQGLSVVEKNSHALTRLINDLLDMSAILSGKMHFELAPVDLLSVVREAVETVRPQAAERRVELEVDCHERADAVMVSGDRTRLKQVCWNLLTNAVKFSDVGGRVRIRCEADRAEARIQVEDAGQGIRPDFLPHVFERFRQADSSKTRSHGGLGLGLALVKSFVEGHGGVVEAASAGEGRGSRFTVRLPRLPSHADRPLLSEPEPAALTGNGRVLLVDDESDTLAMLRAAFEVNGYRTTLCASAAEALRVAASEAFDVIVSDIGMPEVDGYALLGRLRAMPHLKRVPAVALTGYAMQSDADTAARAGFDVHIPKPVDVKSLVKSVDELIRRHREKQ